MALIMKNILVPVDFSPFSLSAARAGAFLSTASGAKVHLLHVADLPPGWSKLPVEVQQEYPAIENRMVEAKMTLDRFTLHPDLQACDLQLWVKGGVAFEQIGLFAQEKGMDMIVMGVHGVGEPKGQFIGSTAQKVIRNSSCPVLAVRKNYHPGSIDKILFASDFDEDLLPALHFVKDIAAHHGSSIDLAYVNTPLHFMESETMLKRMGNFITAMNGVKVDTVIHESRGEEEGILQCVAERQAGMLVMVRHHHQAKPAYLMGLSEGVLFHSKVPVLCIPQ